MKKIFAFVLVVFMLFPVMAEENEQQKNSLAMLNYLTALTQEINDSRSNRVYLEEVYSNLINNTHPNAVDEITQEKLNKLLNRIYEYQKTSIKRERLQILYEKAQTQSIKQAMPNPLFLLNVVQSRDPLKTIISVAMMAADSAMSYSNSNDQKELELLKNGWELDDEERQTLHDIRKEAFDYMLTIVREYKLNGDYALNEEFVESFIRCKNDTEFSSRKNFLERNQKNYSHFGYYWLFLADTYYNLKQYEDCLKAVSRYEDIQPRIFRHDYDYAKVLPFAIYSVQEVYKNDNARVIRETEKYLEKLEINTMEKNWALRYFASQMYILLAHKIGDNKAYLRKAYDLTLASVRYLIENQKDLTQTYIEPVVAAPKDADKSEKEYYKYLNEKRKTELPPLYEPLELNCELLFMLAEKLNISGQDRQEMEKIVFANNYFAFSQQYLKSSRSSTKSLNDMLDDIILKAKFKNDRQVSYAFKQNYLKEYRERYKNKLKEVLVVPDDGNLRIVLGAVNLGLFTADKSSDEPSIVKAVATTLSPLVGIGLSVTKISDAKILKIPTKYIPEGTKVNVKIFSSDNTIKAVNLENVSYKVKDVTRVKGKITEESITTIELDIAKYKFDKKNRYSIIIELNVGTEILTLPFVSCTDTVVWVMDFMEFRKAAEVLTDFFNNPENLY